MKIEFYKVTWYSKLLAVILFLVVLWLGFYIGTKYEKVKIQNLVLQSIQNIGVVYKNTDYGFSLNLPDSWKGYGVIKSEVKSFDGKNIFGSLVTIRNPKWTNQNPIMDIPIQIFSTEQWNKWKTTDFEGYPTAAPVGPTERGSNSKYVFVTAPRYNYSFLPGFEEVENIIKNLKTQ